MLSSPDGLGGTGYGYASNRYLDCHGSVFVLDLW